MHVSPQTAYEHVNELESVDITTGAAYRQEAQDVLADPAVNLTVREAIAERLNQANHVLEMQTVVSDDSY
ncbi:MAG: hypothetical protein VKK04_04335 [Synechococcales bacterium]|nr:hypothetical protein [Synechococcales bacterium]